MPPSDMMLSVRSLAYMQTKVPMTQTGIGEADDARRPGVAQEGVDQQHGEEAAPDGRRTHLADRRGDEVRLVVDFGQLDALGERLADLLHALADACGGLHRVAVAFLVNAELDRLATVDANDCLALLVRALHDGDVLEIDGAVAGRRDDRVGDLLDGSELVEGADEEALVALLQLAA
jgi:hypothetical protein